MSLLPLVRLAKDALVSLAVAAALFAALEAGLRIAAPQLPRTETAGGTSRALPDSILGHRYRPNTRTIHRTPEFTAEYVIDAHGRRARSAPLPVDSAATRVLVLGDSFTFGDANAEEDTWLRVMERSLRALGRAVEVVNAGVEGYDTRAELFYLQELEPEIRPGIVVVGFLTNDVYTNAPVDTPAPKSAAEHRKGGFALHAVEWAKRMAMQNDRVYARLFLLSSRREYYTTPASDRVERQAGITRDLLGRMEGFCRERGIAFVVVSIPQQFAVIAGARDFRFEHIDPTLIDANMATLARERGFPWIETLPELVEDYRERGVDLYHRVDGHLTPEGNAAVGRIAAAAIEPLLANRAAPPASP